MLIQPISPLCSVLFLLLIIEPGKQGAYRHLSFSLGDLVHICPLSSLLFTIRLSQGRLIPDETRHYLQSMYTVYQAIRWTSHQHFIDHMGERDGQTGKERMINTVRNGWKAAKTGKR